MPDGLPDAAEEGEEDEDGEGADERRDQPVPLLEAVVLQWSQWILHGKSMCFDFIGRYPIEQLIELSPFPV